MNKIKTLLVDDSPIDRRFSKFYLESIGLEVETAQDGYEALHLLDNNRFDLIFIDLIMPNLDGFGLINRINSRAEKTDASIIVLSSKNKINDVEKALKLGIEDYIIKPINITKVKSKIKQKFSSYDFSKWQEVPLPRIDQKTIVTISHTAEIVSISERSLTLKSSANLESNSQLSITSNILNDLGLKNCELQLSSSSKSGQYYFTKLKFINPSAELRNNIHRLIKNNSTYANIK